MTRFAPEAIRAPAPRAPAAIEAVRVWPAAAPGTESWTGEEVELDADLLAGRVHIVTNVTVPMLMIVRPPPSRANGTAMLVIPGGAFRALAWDLEGTEVGQWLARRGITAFVLRYRVRPPNDAPSGPEAFDAWLLRTQPARAIAVADARQALRLIRARARNYGLIANRIGMIGFSAGGMAMMELALSPEPSDRPDFAAAIYTAAPSEREPGAGSPPMFVVAARDDPQVPFERSVDIQRRWSRMHLPAEIHLYETGGHGFGLRARNLPADLWPAALEAWLTSRGLTTAGAPVLPQ